MGENSQSDKGKLGFVNEEIDLKPLEIEENTENLLNEKNQKNNSNVKKKVLIFVIVLGAVIIGLGVILILNGQKTASIAKELELGEKYLEEGLYEEAKLAFDKVIEIDKKEVKGYEGKAEVAIILKEYSEAEVLLQESTVIKETDEGQVLMAEVYINTERKEEGKILLNEVKNNGVENLKTVEKTAELYNQLQEYNSTIELLEEKILKTENKEELKKLYDALIEVYVTVGKSEEEIVALLERAAKGIEDPSYIDKKDEILVKIPSFSLVPGEYKGKQTLELIKGKPENKIYYTIDNTVPTEQSKEYTEPLLLTPGEAIIKVIEVNSKGMKSSVLEGKYLIIKDVLSEEEFISSLKGGWYNKEKGRQMIVSEKHFALGSINSGAIITGNYQIEELRDNGGTVIVDSASETGKNFLAEIKIDFGERGDDKIEVTNAQGSFRFLRGTEVEKGRFLLPGLDNGKDYISTVYASDF